jgi:S-formylglutathione hydrolase FrmB
MLDASVLSGALPAAVSLAGVLAVGFLLVRPSRGWWRRVVPASAGASALVVLLADVGLEVWKPFPDPLPIRILFWAGVAILGLALAVANAASASWRRRAALVPAFLLVLILSAMKINAFYGYRPTLGSALGISPTAETNFAEVAGRRPIVLTAPDKPLAQSWRAPSNMPTTGPVTRVDIIGVRSHFHARPASVYLPPAYLASPRPLLPVLVLIAGQPGGPDDWLIAGTLAKIMNSFAATHAGLAPIVVVPDATGSTLGNPLCLDSRLGNAESYLAQDVPDWVKTNLQVDPNPRHWAIAGFSYGGTCALQLAVRKPQLYPTFLDISGQQEPTLGNRPQTVRATYGGNDAQFDAVDPLNILATTRFPATAGIIAVGAGDREYGPQAQRVTDAARNAGISIQLLHLQGGHSWAIATEALRTALPWIASRADLIPSP